MAELGRMTVSPNPMVGAVIERDGEILGEGFHLKKGDPHAEVNAISSSKKSVEGATLYCSLEPCCHTNKTTPPCVDLIIEKKIKKVVVASKDPNPDVSGKGLEKLKAAGIEVIYGVLESESDYLNKVFFKNMKSSLPYLHIKAAITLDGRICSETGSSKWISSEEARREVHFLRESYDAIMIGKNTLRNDNPELTARDGENITKDPFKIIVGNLTDKDLTLNIFKNSEKIINLYTGETKFPGTCIKLNEWNIALKELFSLGVCSILIEGGAHLISSLIEADLFDEATFYVTKKLIGNGTPLFVSGKNKDMENAKNLNGSWRMTASGEAVLEVIN